MNAKFPSPPPRIRPEGRPVSPPPPPMSSKQRLEKITSDSMIKWAERQDKTIDKLLNRVAELESELAILRSKK